jgi:hypothetical protein
MQQNTKTNQMDRHVGLMRGWERMNLLDIFTQSNFDNAFFVLFFFKSPQKCQFQSKTNPISSQTNRKLVKMRDQRYFEV